jgi:hypothetical protein
VTPAPANWLVVRVGSWAIEPAWLQDVFRPRPKILRHRSEPDQKQFTNESDVDAASGDQRNSVREFRRCNVNLQSGNRSGRYRQDRISSNWLTSCVWSKSKSSWPNWEKPSGHCAYSKRAPTYAPKTLGSLASSDLSEPRQGILILRSQSPAESHQRAVFPTRQQVGHTRSGVGCVKRRI